MTPFLVRRLAWGLVNLFIVSMLVFLATNLLPGDPATAILGRDASPERAEALRESLDLDRPLITRYADWLGGLFQGDFGNSLTQGVGSFTESGGNGRPVSDIIKPRLGNTAVLAAVSLALLIVISLAVGTASAIRRGSRGDTLAQVVMLVFISIPEFVLGAVLILLFGFAWPILPAVSLDVSAQNLVLPVLTLVLGLLGVTARLVRVGVIDVLETNYVTNARLRGIPEAQVIRRHVLPNALGPSLQALAIATGMFVGGVVVVEYLFGYPGIGTGFASAVAGRDYPVVQAYALILAGTYIVANVIADTITAVANPRLRDAAA